MKRLLPKLIRDQRGATAVEYGVILLMLVLASMTAIRGFASESILMWDEISSKSAEATGG